MIEIPYDFTGTVEYQRYADIIDRVNKFERFSTIGTDETGEYDMYLIELGIKGKPTLFLTSSMHGTEWQATQYSLKFMENLRDNTFPDVDFRNFLLNNFFIVYIPVMNPWGLERVLDDPDGIYSQFNNTARYTSTGTELNGDFYYLTQQESKNVAEQIDRHKPFAYLDMHMFQPEYGVGYGNKFILANGQRETDNVRDSWRESFENYAEEVMTVWTNTPAPDSGLARAYASRQTNPHTPHTLAYITEFVRPAYVDDVLVELLTKEEIFKYGTASLYLFFKTSMQYYMETRKPQDFKSQTMFVRNLRGNEYPMQVTSTNEGELNGNQSFSCKILPTKVNSVFIEDIAEMWEVVDHDGVTHKIIYIIRSGEGDKLTVEIKAEPLFFDVFNTARIYEEYNDHMTAMSAFTRIFADMHPFSFVLVGQFDAVEWKGFGAGETRLKTFQRALERYKMEFRISGDIVYLERQIGRDTQFMYRHKLNASNVVQEIDANEFYTYAKGYGDYGDGDGGEDWKDAKLIREYTSPLANIPSIGIRHAPPIKNGNITVTSAMDAGLKTLVDDSLKISISASIHDLRRQGYALAQPERGDRVFIIDERIGLNEEVRVVDVSVTRDWRGNVIDFKVAFGSEGLAKRYQSKINTAADRLNDLIEGNIRLPFSAYDQAVQNATKALHGITSELSVPSNGGLMAVDKDDPNNVVLFNAAGMGVSNDGGATFKNSITGEGVIAETIVGQSIIGVNLSSVDESGYFHVNGSDAEFYDVTSNRRVAISPSGLYGYNAGGNIRFQADSSLVTSAAFGSSNDNVYLASAEWGETRSVKFTSIPGSGGINDYSYTPIRSLIYRFPDIPNGYFTLYNGGEFRFTGESIDNPVYQDVRAAIFHGTAFITRTDNAHIGVDGELRVQNKGLTGIYRPIRASIVNAAGFVTTTTHAYVGTDDELRVQNKGLTGTYRNVRANGYFGQFMSAEPGFFSYIGSDLGLRVTSRGLAGGGSPIYRNVSAAAFIVPNDIASITGMASLLSLRPQENEASKLISDIPLSRHTSGEVPEYDIRVDSPITSDDGEGKNINKAVMYILKSQQETIGRLNKLEGIS